MLAQMPMELWQIPVLSAVIGTLLWMQWQHMRAAAQDRRENAQLLQGILITSIAHEKLLLTISLVAESDRKTEDCRRLLIAAEAAKQIVADQGERLDRNFSKGQP